MPAGGSALCFPTAALPPGRPNLPPRLAGALTDAAVLFLSGYYLLQAKQARFVLKAAELAKASGGLVALDPSPMIGSVAAEVLEPLLAVTDFIFPNKRELRLLTGGVGDEERGIGALLERTKHIVLKLGGGGVRVWHCAPRRVYACLLHPRCRCPQWIPPGGPVMCLTAGL